MVVGANFLLSHGMKIAQGRVITALKQDPEPGRVQTQYQRMVAKNVAENQIH